MKVQNTTLLLDVEILKVKSLTSILLKTRLEKFLHSLWSRQEKIIKNTDQVMREAAANEISADSAAAAV